MFKSIRLNTWAKASRSPWEDDQESYIMLRTGK